MNWIERYFPIFKPVKPPFVMPFSGATPEELYRVWEYLSGVERDHKMVVEALDCILSEWDPENPDASLIKGMWKATCEWDL